MFELILKLLNSLGPIGDNELSFTEALAKLLTRLDSLWDFITAGVVPDSQAGSSEAAQDAAKEAAQAA